MDLANSKKITLHVPFVVEREFETHLEQDQREKLEIAAAKISSALKFQPRGPHSVRLAGNLKELKSELSSLVQERIEAFTNWLLEIGAERHHLTLDQTQKAMEAYFIGAPPFKRPKVRDSIPDSFIFQQFLHLKEKYGSQFGVVTSDNALCEASQDAGISCWSNLWEFLSSAEAQPLIAEQFIVQHKKEICMHVLTLAKSAEDDIAEALEHALQSEMYVPIEAANTFSETGEISLSGYDRPYKITLNQVDYIGGMVFLVNVVAEVELMYEFMVLKSDAIHLDTTKFGLSAVNKYYLEAESTDTFRLSARVELEFPQWEGPLDDVQQLKSNLGGLEVGAADLRDFQIIDSDTGW